MDLNLELSFVLVVKTILTTEACPALLPMRIDDMFEGYIRFAALLLKLPELDFRQSSYNIRQFAKALEKKGFVGLNTKEDADVVEDPVGLVVMKIRHSIIDDIYMDSSVFSVLGRDSEHSDEELNMTDDEFDSDKLCPCQPLRDNFKRGEVFQRRRQRLTQDMLRLCSWHDEQNAKAEQEEKRKEKQTRKVVEKELRSMNVRVSTGGKFVDSKYQRRMKQDNAARAFELSRAGSSRSGLYGLGGIELMLAIANKTGQKVEGNLPGRCRLTNSFKNVPLSVCSGNGGSSSAFGHGNPPVANEAPLSFGPGNPPMTVAAPTGFERQDDPFGIRGVAPDGSSQKVRDVPAGRKNPTEKITAEHAQMKISREQRKLLQLLGFEHCRNLMDLPKYADLRQSYKKTLLALHPDKAHAQMENVGASSMVERDDQTKNIKSSKEPLLATTTFQEFQEQYMYLLKLFYDVDKQSFSAKVQKQQSSQAASKKSVTHKMTSNSKQK